MLRLVERSGQMRFPSLTDFIDFSGKQTETKRQIWSTNTRHAGNNILWYKYSRNWFHNCSIEKENIPWLSDKAHSEHNQSLPCHQMASLLFTAICKSSSDNHFAFLHFFFLGMFLITACCTMLRTSVRTSSGTLSIRSNPLNLFVTSTVKS